MLTGRSLRGSHTDWEPFERSTSFPVRPGRVYAGTAASAEVGQPIDLTPLVAVRVCPQCKTYELFLINQARGEEITLRSLEGHSVSGGRPTAAAESSQGDGPTPE